MRHRISAFSLAFLLAASSLAAQTQPDPNIDLLGQDLRTLGRIAELARDLGDNRQVMLAIVDADLQRLRGPRDDGTYQWAQLQRVEATRVSDEKSIERVSTEAELRNVAVTATNAYRLEVKAPSKRNLVSANNRVYLRNVLVDCTGFDGRTTHHQIPVNAWINPGDSNGVALPEICKSAKATAELGVESGEKKAVAQVSLLQAKLVDDPKGPYYPATQRLLQIRELAAARDLQRGALKSIVDEALLALPGEMDKRNAEQQAMLARRTQATGTLQPGDASPDVVNAMREIQRLLGGTLEEQASARTKLQSLVDSLSPPAPPAQ
ncbi:MAG TPA: hypothetical protein VGR02_05430 [Thermoanaerobaculia bacterium]|jgi:hypothetical protein|nr:hypothetical protein [Thermoanaerobaculia bacterium]